MSMPIILAIEPDRRQAAHVSAVVRHRVGAELILAETTEGALDAIGSRVPDLVLVPALLSPQDDAALAAALRVIAAAAHVRTLTIPVFANGTVRAQGGGLLARFRRGRSEQTSVGCDPAVFADQITEYLREAAAERADIESASEPIDEPIDESIDQPIEEPVSIASYVIEAPAAVVAPRVAVVQARPPIVHEEPAPAASEELVAFEAAAPPLDFVEATSELLADESIADEPTSEDEPSEDEPSDDEIVIDLSDEVTEISPERSAEELFDGEPVGVYTLSLDESLDTSIDAIARFAKIEEAEEDKELEMAAAVEAVAEIRAAAEVAATIDVAPFEAETVVDLPESKPIEDTAWLSLGLRYTRRWPTLEGVLVETGTTVTEFAAAPVNRIPAVDDAAPLPTPIVTPAQAPPTTTRPDHLEWAELVASLRQDIERRRKQFPAAPTVAARPAEPRTSTQTADAVQSRRSRKSTPIQDEWGFFDPQQCGFAALLAKLDEFSDGPDEPAARPPS
jgi:hypothetical protein